jgi:DNA-directed RNA polymerase specialized sigma24 family protein
VFLLRVVHGLSYKEIAEIMGTSSQTVANQLSHALATLRHDLGHLLD